ncbi:MAG: hypothetical protein HOV94_23900, partial [Saccharothrix sp.]|nr:hypothetical protein [Saccharothrix sp.]
KSLTGRPQALAFRAPGGALAARGAGAFGGGSVTTVNVTVQGSVISEKRLFDTVQRQTLQYQLRNPNNGLSLTGTGR